MYFTVLHRVTPYFFRFGYF